MSQDPNSIPVPPHLISLIEGLGPVMLPQTDGSYSCPCPFNHNGSPLFSERNLMEAHLHHINNLFTQTERITIDDGSYTCPVLQDMGYIVSDAHKVLVCTYCQIALLPTHAIRHYKKKHSGRLNRTQEEAFNVIVNKYGILAEFPPPSKSPIPHIPGIPIHELFPCEVPGCVHLRGSIDSLKRHHREEHKDLPFIECGVTTRKVHGQQFNTSSSKQYFTVTLPRTGHVDDDELVSTIIERHMLKPALNEDPDVRNISPWLKFTLWHNILNNSSLTPTQLHDLTKPPRPEEQPGVFTAVRAFFMTTLDLVEATPILLRQKINTPHEKKTGITNHPFQRHQNDTTNESYATILVRFIAMVCRITKEFPIDFSEEEIKCLDNLRDRPSPEFVFEFLRAVWFRVWTHTPQQNIFDPTVLFIALDSLLPTGQFKGPKLVTNVIARLEYSMRLVVVRHISNHKDEASPSDCFEELRPWIQEKERESPFNTLRTYQHYATSIAMQTTSLPRAVWLDPPQYETLLFKGDRVDISGIRGMLAAQEHNLIDALEAKVLLGTGLTVSPVLLHDDLSDTTAGYSLYTDPRNTVFANSSELLLRAILGNQNLKRRFITNHIGTTVEWNRGELLSWLDEYAQFHLQMLVRCNLTAGNPCRGTELTAMLLCNTPLQPIRNLVAFGTSLSVVVTYSKMTSITKQDKLIPHALDGFLSDVLIQELAIARPFAVLASQICYPSSTSQNQLLSQHVFSNFRRLFTTSDLSHGLSATALGYIDAPLTVNSWRHIMTTFRRKRCSAANDLLEDDSAESVDALQEGHTRATENRIYGITQYSFTGVEEDALVPFIHVSKVWQYECKVVPGGLLLHYRQATAGNFHQLVTSGVFTRPFGEEDSGANNVTSTLSHLVKTISRLESIIQAQFPSSGAHVDTPNKAQITPPTMGTKYADPEVTEDTITHLPSPGMTIYSPTTSIRSDGNTHQSHGKIVKTIAAQPEDLPENEPKTPNAPTPCIPTLSKETESSVEQCAISHLRKLTGIKTAEWNSHKQKEAVLAVAEGLTDVVAILPTGSGKTMIPLIPAVMERQESTPKTTVIILPFTSLILDYSRKLSHMNVPHQTYIKDLGLSTTSSIVLVSANMSVTRAFQTALAELDVKQPVSRYVFDEAHIVGTSEGFRPTLSKVDTIRQIKAPFVLLTGTLSPQALEHATHKFKLCRDALVIRCSSNRPDLRFHWLPSLAESEYYQKLKSLIDLHCSEASDRALIFVNSIQWGSSLSQILGCPFFFAEADQRTVYGEWISGMSKAMVCTSAFGCGNDYSHVRVVIHTEQPYELVDYYQSASRAGRDGKGGYCILLPRSEVKLNASTPRQVNHNDSTPVNQDLSGRVHMRNALEGLLCIRFTLTTFLDGKGEECFSDPRNKLCSRCENPSTQRNKRQLPASFAEATTMAKRKRLQISQGPYDKVTFLDKCINLFFGICAFCAYHNLNSVLTHDVSHCPTLKKLGTTGYHGYFDFKRTIIIPNDYSTCFKCYIPLIGDSTILHPPIHRGAPCPRQDIIPATLYCLSLDRPSLTLVLGRLQIDPNIRTVSQFLNASPIPSSHISLLTALFVELCVLKYSL